MPVVHTDVKSYIEVINVCCDQVPFTDVLELVRGLKVYVHRGFAFVPQPEFVVIVVNVFRSRLSHALVVSYVILITILVININNNIS